MINLNKIIGKFLFYCEFEKNLSPKSLKSYTIDLKQFNNFLNGKKITNPRKVSKEFIRMYICHLEKFYKPKSIKRKVAIIKAFFTFMEYEYDLPSNPFRKMKIRIKDPESIPIFMELSEVNLIFKVVFNELSNSTQLSNFKRNTLQRDIAILELLFATGIRVSELCDIKKNSINLKTGLISIYGKGNKKRLIRINSNDTLDAIKRYYSAFSIINNTCEYFFINKFGNQISAQSVRLMVKKYAQKAMIRKNVTPHVFRHTYATLLLEEDVDIKYIQHLLGHSSIMTTQIYTHVNTRKIDQILLKKHPRRLISASFTNG